jgi:8-oxo-dGTP pyrophosphatase MutT (NUDIX family)
MPFEKSAGAIIFHKNKEIKYLLLHYPSSKKSTKDYWDLPKGHIEKGEKEIETVKREVKEETGLDDVEIIGGFKEWIKYFFRSTPYQNKSGTGQEGKTIFKIVTFYLAKTKEKNINISEEHIGYKWLPYEEALEELTFDNAKKILTKANQFLNKHAAVC